MKKKISIITVVKNGMPYLKSALKIFHKQKYKNKEIIIIYSKSTDGTLEFLKKNKKKYNKLIIDKDSKNKFGSLNIGIKKSKGDVVGILHSDDIYPNNNILEDIMKIFNNKKIDIVYGNTVFCKKENQNKIIRIWKSNKFKYSDLKYGWMPPHTTLYISKKIISKNLYSLKYPISGDYKFILDLFSKKNIKTEYLNKNLIKMRSGGDSTRINNIAKKFIEDIKIAKKYFKFYYICIIFKILRKIKQFTF